MNLLERADDREQFLAFGPEEDQELCNEIRSFLINSVSKTGGHLASNLGIVELTIALHKVFDPYKDRIVFDVGHQCYVHKLLTGRQAEFRHFRIAVLYARQRCSGDRTADRNAWTSAAAGAG